MTGLFRWRLLSKHTGEYAFYFSSADTRNQFFFGCRMSYEKHNRWRRIIPEGWSNTMLKNKLAKTALNGRDRGILRLVLDCAPPPPDHEYDIRDAITWKAAIDAGLTPPAPLQRPPPDQIDDNKKYFNLSVKFICASLNFDPLKTWPRARKRLELCVSKCGKKKLLQIGFKPLSGGDYQWFLAFDFTCLTDGSLDAPPLVKMKKKQTMTNDKLKQKWGARVSQSNCTAHDPAILAGSEPEEGEGLAFEPNTNTNAASTPPHAGEQQTQPSLPLPLPLPSAVLSPPPLGGGVLASSEWIKLLEDSVFFDLKKFYDFSKKNGVDGINVHHQKRNKINKINGKIERGGTFNPYLKNDYNRLCWLVRRAASRRWELGCSGGQFLLIDDLDINSVREFMTEKFTVCILQTSQGNFQALLPKIGTWSDLQVKETQAALSNQFGGDANAISARQPHRLPGSLNQKNHGCFVTKLALIQEGKILDPLDFCNTDVIEKSVVSTKKQGHRNDSGRDDTASGQDFGLVCSMLKTKKSDQEILSQLLASCDVRGKKGNHKKYANLTLKNARASLKM